MARERASDWLKRTRIGAGYPKQAALATAIGVSRSTVGNWEVGIGKPDPGVVPKLASTLGVSQQEIIERFGISVGGGDLVTPAPPWAQELIARIDPLAKALERSGMPESLEAAHQLRGLDPDTLRTRRAFWIWRTRRARFGGDTRAAARAADSTTRELSGWEGGTLEPTAAQQARLASAFEVSPALFDDPPETPGEVVQRFRVAHLTEQLRDLRQDEEEEPERREATG